MATIAAMKAPLMLNIRINRFLAQLGSRPYIPQFSPNSPGAKIFLPSHSSLPLPGGGASSFHSTGVPGLRRSPKLSNVKRLGSIRLLIDRTSNVFSSRTTNWSFRYSSNVQEAGYQQPDVASCFTALAVKNCRNFKIFPYRLPFQT